MSAARFAGRWSFKEKRFVSFFLIYASTFVQGVEIAVVLPTAWKYLQRLGVHDETFLGFLISTYSVTAVIAGLLVGHWVDRSDNTRKVLLYLNVSQIFGNILYFIGLHPGMLLAARFLSGFGSGIGSACFSDLSRASKVSERTTILTVAFAMRQVGQLVGPIYTLALHRVDVTFGPFRLNEESAPGLVMALYWTIFQVLIYFLYSNVGREYHRQGIRVKKMRRRFDSSSYGSTQSCDSTTSDHEDFEASTTDVDIVHHHLGENRPSDHDRDRVTKKKMKKTVDDDRGENNNEDACETRNKPGTWMSLSQQYRWKQQNYLRQQEQLREQERLSYEPGPSGSQMGTGKGDETTGLLSGHQTRNQQDATSRSSDTGSTTGRTSDLVDSLSGVRRSYLEVFLDDRLIPLLFLQTIAYFVVTMVQTIIPPAVEHYFGYGTKVTSLIFMVAGAEGLIIYVAMLFIAQRVQDRVLVVVGYVMMFFSIVVTGYVSYLLSDGSGIDSDAGAAADLFWPLVAGFGVIFISVPMLSAAAVALMSKVVDRSSQGMAQGLRRMSLFMGVVFGPLWGGTMIYRPIFLYGVSLVLLIIAGVLFALSFRKLFVCHETADNQSCHNGSASSVTSEVTPSRSNVDSKV